MIEAIDDGTNHLLPKDGQIQTWRSRPRHFDMSKVVVNRLIVPIVPATAAFAFVTHKRVIKNERVGVWLWLEYEYDM